MAIKPWCYWSIGVQGDGSITSASLNLLSDPFVLGAAAGAGAGAQLGTTFLVSISNLPSSISVVASSDGQTVTPTLGSGGAVSFAWPIAIPAGDFVTMYGKLTF